MPKNFLDHNDEYEMYHVLCDDDVNDFHEDEKKDIYTLTISVNSPKSYAQDLSLIRRVLSRFRHTYSRLEVCTASLQAYECPTKQDKKYFRMHSYFSATEKPQLDEEFVKYLKHRNVKITIMEDFKGWFEFCISHSKLGHEKTYAEWKNRNYFLI